MGATYTLLKGVSNFWDSQFSEQLGPNLVDFLNWSLLSIGGFINVTITPSYRFWRNRDVLMPVRDENYLDGQVWQGFRSNWVWESGIEFPVQPIPVTGVFINGSGYAFHSGDYVDYPGGKIVFNDPFPVTGIVMQANYSYRAVNCYTSDETWFEELMFNAYKVDLTQDEQPASGLYRTLEENRVQLPAIIVEPVPRTKYTPYQLGGGANVYQDVLFHVFAESNPMRNKLVDLLTNQKEHVIYLYDRDAMFAANATPLNPDGSIASGAMTYPNLVDPGKGFFWKKCTWFDTFKEETDQIFPLYRGIVRATFWSIFNNL